MAGNTVDIRVVAHDLASRTMDGVGKGLGKVGKGLLGIGGAGSAVQVLGGVAAAGAQLLPIALALPGAILSGAAAMATFKVATAGFGEALNAKDPKAFAEATKDMAPAMRDTAVEVRKLKDGPLKDLKKEVQGKFWAGFAAETKELGGIYIPKLKTGMSSVAKEMNFVGKNLSTALKSSAVSGSVDKIFSNTAGMIRNAQSALGGFVGGFVKLGAVGSDYLPKVGIQIDKIADKFNNWVDKGVKDNSFKRMIDGAIAGFKDLGAIGKNVGSIIGSIFTGLSGGAASPLASLRELTAKVAEFMKSLQAQNALRAFGDMLRVVSGVVQDVFMAALRQLAPIIEKLSPVVSAVAKALGETLMGAIAVVGPMIQNLATWMGQNSDSLAKWAQFALVAWAAWKGYTILIAARAAITGVVAASGGLGAVAGLLAKVAGIVGIGIVANELDKLNMASAGGDPAKLGMMEQSLHGIVEAVKGLATNPGAALQDLGGDVDEVTTKFITGKSAISEFYWWTRRLDQGFSIPPIDFKVETGPAQAQVDGFIAKIGEITPSVNINGNVNNAGFALRTILAEIAAGHSSVTIDGKPMPAQDALRLVIDMINASAGTATINGEAMPAGEALARILAQVSGSSANFDLGADDNATSTIQGIVNTWQGYTIRLNAVVSSRVGGLAKGGNSGGGLTWVGERGPELVRAMAGGGNRGRGRTLVGERGPELVNLPPGSQVTPTGKTRQMLAQGGGGGGSGAVGVVFSGGIDSAFATYFMKLYREGKIQIGTA